MRCPNCGGDAVVLDVESAPTSAESGPLVLRAFAQLLCLLGLSGQPASQVLRVTIVTRAVQCLAPAPWGCSTTRCQRETRIVEDLGVTAKRYVRAG